MKILSNVSKTISNFFNSFTYILFPVRCVYCGRFLPVNDKVRICLNCLRTIRKIDFPYCKVCGTPLDGGENCFDCQKKKYKFDLLRSYALYDGVIREMIHMFKYRNKEYLSKPLALFLYEAFKFYKELNESEIVLSVPLHWLKKYIRGYNQTELLAKEFSRLSNLPYFSEVIYKLKYTKSQTRLSKELRRKNVDGTFVVKHREKIHGKNVLLIDDVSTTGSTLNECAKVLKSNGAQKVFCLTLARDVLVD